MPDLSIDGQLEQLVSVAHDVRRVLARPSATNFADDLSMLSLCPTDVEICSARESVHLQVLDKTEGPVLLAFWQDANRQGAKAKKRWPLALEHDPHFYISYNSIAAVWTYWKVAKEERKRATLTVSRSAARARAIECMINDYGRCMTDLRIWNLANTSEKTRPYPLHRKSKVRSRPR
jgi:hypothetical protein